MTPTYRKAIQSIESSGGNYSLLGPVTKTGDRAYGAYQVMGNNVPEWTQTHLGRRMSPDEFLADKDAQDKVFDAQFGGYVNKYGNPQDAASAWFTGGPLSTGANKRDILGTSGQSYADKFNSYVAANGGEKSDLPPGALSFAPTESKSMPALSAENTMGPGILNMSGGEGFGSGGSASAIGQGLTGIGAALAGISSPDQAKALNQQLALMQKGPADRGTWSVQTMPNGQAFMLNNKTQQMQPIGNYAKPEADEYTKEAQKASAKSNQELGDQINQNARDAAGLGQTVTEIRTALSDPNLKQGIDGPARQFLNKTYSALGFGDSATAATAANGDIASALSNKLALQLVNSGGVKLLPGSFSDSDRKFVTQMSTSLSNTPEANTRLLDIYDRANKYTQQAEDLRAAHVTNNQVIMPSFRKELSDLSASQLKEAQAEAAARPAATSQATKALTGPLKSGAYVWDPKTGTRSK